MKPDLFLPRRTTGPATVVTFDLYHVFSTSPFFSVHFIIRRPQVVGNFGPKVFSKVNLDLADEYKHHLLKELDQFRGKLM